jgi:hypothetical protein
MKRSRKMKRHLESIQQILKCLFSEIVLMVSQITYLIFAIWMQMFLNKVIKPSLDSSS